MKLHLTKVQLLWVLRHDSTHPPSNSYKLEGQPFIGNLCLSKRCGPSQCNFARPLESLDPRKIDAYDFE